MIIKKGTIDSQLPRDYVARIGLLADIHIGYDVWGDYSALQTIVENMNKKKPDFCFALGDSLDSGYNHTATLKAEQLAIFNEKFSKLRSPLFRLKGNHDADVDEFTEFGVVTFNGLRFICIFPKYSSNGGVLTEGDISWIDNALAEGDGYRNIILCHYAVAPKAGANWGVSDEGLRDDLVALTTQYGVDLFLNGHEHQNGLANEKVDGTNMIDVQIPSAVTRYAVLTIYNDRYELVEYSCATDEQTATLTIPFT